MATKLSSNPIRSRLNTKEPFAESSRIIVVPLRSWKYAVLIALPSLGIIISVHARKSIPRQHISSAHKEGISLNFCFCFLT
jgi:hypothetical protein